MKKLDPKSFPSFSPNSVLSEKIKTILLTLFFTLLFYLCSADQFFTTRIHGFNVRWGQFLLLGCGLLSWGMDRVRSSVQPSEKEFLRRILKIWMVFFLCYALAALASDFPRLTWIKWGWGLFNIGCAALICLQSRWNQPLRLGFKYAILGIALTLWAEVLALFWFHIPFHTGYEQASYPLIPSFFHLSPVIGYVKTSYSWMGTVFVRPNAFYYEPSYAGCALSFALPLVWALNKDLTKFAAVWQPALVLSAIAVTGSRSGLLGSFLCLSVLTTYAFLKNQPETKRRIFKTILATGLIILVFLVSTDSRKYMHFLFLENLGAQSTLLRIADPKSSEGGRVVNQLNTFQQCLQHPWLGTGVTPASSGSGHELGQTNLNTWLEIGLEAGLLGLLGFLFAVVSTMREAWHKNAQAFPRIWVLAAWAVHFLVNLNFTQTFPRLDYWLLFFLSISLLAQTGRQKLP